MRVFLQYILPLITPIVLYVLWLVLRGRGKEMPNWNEGPWFWLIVVGFVFAAASLITFGVTNLEGTEGEYVAPRYEDGKILPPERH
jgi:hypothetical protein